ncbi:MAG: hypothetical protein KDK99_12935 [Verrucomicrobiales bacterium]|nr:hypothetical protein [Verrucomicrobiales bacterium]
MPAGTWIHREAEPLKKLLRGEVVAISEMLQKGDWRGVIRPCVVAILLGSGCYGAALGLWRAPMMALYVGIKMPLLVGLTLLVNGLLNGMLAQVLGSGLSFRQTLTACLMSFAIFSLVAGSLSPVVMAAVLDAPERGTEISAAWYRGFLLSQTAVIAGAGVLANYRLLKLLRHVSGSDAVGTRTLLAWLTGNLFVGAQLSYTLRPFFGNPDLEVQFLRPNPFEGNFYEAVWGMMDLKAWWTVRPELAFFGGVVLMLILVVGVGRKLSS